jgi:hypothetical protein
MLLAPLNNSIVFKKLFRDPEVLTEFVRDLTGAPVQFDADHIELEKQFNPPIAGIDTRFDVFAEDPLHRAIVEVQRVRYDDHFDRFFHYHMVSILEQQKNYKLYGIQRTVYTIVWSVRPSKNPRYQKALITTRHHSEDSDGEEMLLYPHKLFFINPFHTSTKLKPAVFDWLQLASESIKNPDRPQLNLSRPIFSRAATLIEEQDLSAADRAEIINETEWERNLRNNREEGLKEGLERGLERGIEQGIEQGRLAEKQETARKMLSAGIDPAQIATFVELPIEQIVALKAT